MHPQHQIFQLPCGMSDSQLDGWLLVMTASGARAWALSTNCALLNGCIHVKDWMAGLATVHDSGQQQLSQIGFTDALSCASDGCPTECSRISRLGLAL
jgi:hypothetical protein